MVDGKLTLSIKQEVIDSSKTLAKRKGVSLSDMIESILLGMITMNNMKIPTSKKKPQKSIVDAICSRAPRSQISDSEARKFKIERLTKKHA